MSEKVLSPEDFKQLRKLRLQKSIEWHRLVGTPASLQSPCI